MIEGAREVKDLLTRERYVSRMLSVSFLRGIWSERHSYSGNYYRCITH